MRRKYRVCCIPDIGRLPHIALVSDRFKKTAIAKRAHAKISYPNVDTQKLAILLG